MASVTALHPRTKRRLRVLVVEDNLDGLQSMAYLFRDMGHEVQFAINGFAALDIARRFKPEVIIIDMLLPDAHGADIARQLRYEPGLEKARMLAISAQAGQRDRAMAAGCVAFYEKPLDPNRWEEILAANEG